MSLQEEICTWTHREKGQCEDTEGENLEAKERASEKTNSEDTLIPDHPISGILSALTNTFLPSEGRSNFYLFQ